MRNACAHPLCQIRKGRQQIGQDFFPANTTPHKQKSAEGQRQRHNQKERRDTEIHPSADEKQVFNRKRYTFFLHNRKNRMAAQPHT